MNAAAKNKALIAQAFARWGEGEGDFFDLLTPDACWTIAGSHGPAGSYRGREAYLAAGVRPLMQRLAGPVRPRDLHLVAEGDEVVARWSQDTPLKAGGRYRNDYAWFLSMEAGRIVAATASLDLDAFVRATEPAEDARP